MPPYRRSSLAYNGLRIDEALSSDVEPLGHQQGHGVLRISRKGGRDALAPLSHELG